MATAAHLGERLFLYGSGQLGGWRVTGLHVTTTRVAWQWDQLSLTISPGCASMKGQESIDYLLMMADRALYQAKEQGRNRVVISTQ